MRKSPVVLIAVDFNTLYNPAARPVLADGKTAKLGMNDIHFDKLAVDLLSMIPGELAAQQNLTIVLYNASVKSSLFLDLQAMNRERHCSVFPAMQSLADVMQKKDRRVTFSGFVLEDVYRETPDGTHHQLGITYPDIQSRVDLQAPPEIKACVNMQVDGLASDPDPRDNEQQAFTDPEKRLMLTTLMHHCAHNHPDAPLHVLVVDANPECEHHSALENFFKNFPQILPKTIQALHRVRYVPVERDVSGKLVRGVFEPLDALSLTGGKGIVKTYRTIAKVLMAEKAIRNAQSMLPPSQRSHDPYADGMVRLVALYNMPTASLVEVAHSVEVAVSEMSDKVRAATASAAKQQHAEVMAAANAPRQKSSVSRGPGMFAGSVQHAGDPTESSALLAWGESVSPRSDQNDDETDNDASKNGSTSHCCSCCTIS